MNLDPKLLAAFAAALVVALGARVGLGADDPLVVTGAALAAGLVAGFFQPNDGTMLRSVQQSGNPDESLVRNGPPEPEGGP